MAISTYAELQTAIGNWLARSDLTATIPDFIALFEADANMKLHTRLQETSAVGAPVAGVITLPADYHSTVRVTWQGSTRRELAYMHPSTLQALYPDASAGTPGAYTIEGSSLIVRPVDNDTDVELLYRARIPSLSDSVTTNWLLTKAPQLYLFGSLCEAQGFNIDMEKMGVWMQRRDAAYADMLLQDFRQRGGMSIQVTGDTP